MGACPPRCDWRGFEGENPRLTASHLKCPHSDQASSYRCHSGLTDHTTAVLLTSPTLGARGVVTERFPQCSAFLARVLVSPRSESRGIMGIIADGSALVTCSLQNLVLMVISLVAYETTIAMSLPQSLRTLNLFEVSNRQKCGIPGETSSIPEA